MHSIPNLIADAVKNDVVLNLFKQIKKKKDYYSKMFSFQKHYLQEYLTALEQDKLASFPFDANFLYCICRLLKGVEGFLNDMLEQMKHLFFNS